MSDLPARLEALIVKWRKDAIDSGDESEKQSLERFGTTMSPDGYCRYARTLETCADDLAAALVGAEPPADQPNPPCERCGGPHPTDTVVPSIRWNAVVRANGAEDYLCTPCIIRDFVTRGESFTADIDGVAFEVRVNSQPAKDALDVSEENTRLRSILIELGHRDLIPTSSAPPGAAAPRVGAPAEIDADEAAGIVRGLEDVKAGRMTTLEQIDSEVARVGAEPSPADKE